MKQLACLAIAMLVAGCKGPMMVSPDAILPDGSRYKGEIRDGRFHGHGILRFDEKGWYEGEFADGQMEGQGELHAVDGRYQGEFRDGEFHGQGRWEYRNGEVYEGRFEEGEPADVVVTGDWGRYEGEMADWLYHGQGVFEMASGGVYTARFEEGEPVAGRYEDGQQRYQGEFSGWSYQGQGTLEHLEREETLSGQFQYGYLVQGVKHYGNGGEYRGEFRYGEPEGEGELLLPDGRRFVGEFSRGRPKGAGTMYPASNDGEPVEGRWYRSNFYADGEKTPREERAETVEAILVSDVDRLTTALDAVQAQRAGKPDVYYLIVGGDGDDSVFTRDVVVAQDALEAGYPASGRGVVLVNERNYDLWPLATRHNIRAALARLAQQMYRNEDLLFIHLASHGRRDGTLVLDQPGLSLPDLTPEEFRSMLAPHDFGRHTIVVSACHAGHWLDVLAADNNLVLASAQRDRRSFGCGNASDMTWFTRAVYEEAGLDLSQPAIEWLQVETSIRAWEDEKGLSEEARSLPQIHIGDAFSWEPPASQAGSLVEAQ